MGKSDRAESPLKDVITSGTGIVKNRQKGFPEEISPKVNYLVNYSFKFSHGLNIVLQKVNPFTP